MGQQRTAIATARTWLFARLVTMSQKRLSEGGDKVVLADAAKAERKLRHRPKQLPALVMFLAIAAALAIYKIFFDV
jgi:hypothetical protein